MLFKLFDSQCKTNDWHSWPYIATYPCWWNSKRFKHTLTFFSSSTEIERGSRFRRLLTLFFFMRKRNFETIGSRKNLNKELLNKCCEICEKLTIKTNGALKSSSSYLIKIRILHTFRKIIGGSAVQNRFCKKEYFVN